MGLRRGVGQIVDHILTPHRPNRLGWHICPPRGAADNIRRIAARVSSKAQPARQQVVRGHQEAFAGVVLIIFLFQRSKPRQLRLVEVVGSDSIAGQPQISQFRNVLRSVLTSATHGWFLAVFMMLVSGCATPTGSIALIGTPNFHQINSRLYRSAQPSLEGLSALAGSGIKTVINLRMGDDILPQEEETTKAAGMTYRNVPLSGWRRPTDAQVNAVLSLIESSTPPVLVHCERGADRTGTIIACYRIRFYLVDQGFLRAFHLR